MYREGVRRGRMLIQIPFFIVGPELAAELMGLRDDEKVQEIFSSVVDYT